MVNELSNENEMILLSNYLQRGHVGGSGHRVIMCGSRKYPYPPHGRQLEIPRGRRGSRAVISEG